GLLLEPEEFLEAVGVAAGGDQGAVVGGGEIGHGDDAAAAPGGRRGGDRRRRPVGELGADMGQNVVDAEMARGALAGHDLKTPSWTRFGSRCCVKAKPAEGNSTRAAATVPRGANELPPGSGTAM